MYGARSLLVLSTNGTSDLIPSQQYRNDRRECHFRVVFFFVGSFLTERTTGTSSRGWNHFCWR